MAIPLINGLMADPQVGDMYANLRGNSGRGTDRQLTQYNVGSPALRMAIARAAQDMNRISGNTGVTDYNMAGQPVNAQLYANYQNASRDAMMRQWAMQQQMQRQAMSPLMDMLSPFLGTLMGAGG